MRDPSLCPPAISFRAPIAPEDAARLRLGLSLQGLRDLLLGGLLAALLHAGLPLSPAALAAHPALQFLVGASGALVAAHIIWPLGGRWRGLELLGALGWLALLWEGVVLLSTDAFPSLRGALGGAAGRGLMAGIGLLLWGFAARELWPRAHEVHLPGPLPPAQLDLLLAVAAMRRALTGALCAGAGGLVLAGSASGLEGAGLGPELAWMGVPALWLSAFGALILAAYRPAFLQMKAGSHLMRGATPQRDARATPWA